jgi:hypothetical protein
MHVIEFWLENDARNGRKLTYKNTLICMLKDSSKIISPFERGLFLFIYFFFLVYVKIFGHHSGLHMLYIYIYIYKNLLRMSLECRENK